MRLRPRHYLLFLIIVGVFVWNMVRRHHRASALESTPAPIVHTGPPPQSPGWSAFDAAATLRDAPDTQYLPALKSLQSTIPSDPNHADISGCLTWLEFYRQGMAHAGSDPQARQRSLRHLDGCTQLHLDASL